MTKGRSHAGPSRATSVRPASTARSILKAREKPFRTEKHMVMTKKKPALSDSSQRPPQGFTFVAYGSGPLIDRCRELSKEQNEKVYIVRAKAIRGDKDAFNPDKLSFHVHRVGFHFKSEIVEDACAELNYTFQNGKFMHWTEIQKQNEELRTAQFLAQRGIRISPSSQTENEDVVIAAMKEQFPNMPLEEMKAVYKHAWEPGSDRIGTKPNKSLARRVQLAVLARIRHHYTDYDYLLKAFGAWAAARGDIEPICAAKMREWRGENAQDEENEQEWVQRDLVILDDDDDQDEDEGVVLVDGDDSDTSLEITHVQARAQDLEDESANEASHRYAARVQQRYNGPQPHIRQPQYTYPAPEQQAVLRPLPPPQQPAYRYPVLQENQPPLQTAQRYHPEYPSIIPVALPSAPLTPVRIVREEVPDVYREPQPPRHWYPQQQPHNIPTVSALPLPGPTGPDEVIFNGRVFRKVAPSIERDPPRPIAAPPPGMLDVQGQRYPFVDLTIDDAERRLRPSLPVHGAPAPVQQVPRVQYMR